MISKTQQALALLRSDPNMSKYEAAKQVGLSPTALYAAIKREQDHYARVRCPCCDHALRPGAVVADPVAAYKSKLIAALEQSAVEQPDHAAVFRGVINYIKKC